MTKRAASGMLLELESDIRTLKEDLIELEQHKESKTWIKDYDEYKGLIKGIRLIEEALKDNAKLRHRLLSYLFT